MINFELILTRAWQKNSPYLSLLAPLSGLYGLISLARKQLYQQGILPVYQAPVPVLVVGNITVGGSGKTPLIIALVQYLQSKNILVGVISRGYGRQDSNTPYFVTEDATPQQAGDEPYLIFQSTGVPIAVGSNRQQAIKLLLKHHPDITFIISDDGLQHYSLARQFEWIVVDGTRGFGNKKLLPQGFLREPVSRLVGATVIYHDKNVQNYPKNTRLMHLEPDVLMPLLSIQNQSIAKSTKVYAVSGIGYPERFFQTLTELGFEVIPKPFSDHHDFCLEDLVDLDDFPIITTSKDAVKMAVLAKTSKHKIFNNIWILPVKAVLSDAVYDTINQLLVQIGRTSI